jgi:hypothetical protein
MVEEAAANARKVIVTVESISSALMIPATCADSRVAVRTCAVASSYPGWRPSAARPVEPASCLGLIEYSPKDQILWKNTIGSTD